MSNSSLSVMIVAGEASGDAHGARLVRRLREMESNAAFFGAAGPLLRAEGVEPVIYSDELSVVGIAEIGRALPMFISAMRKLKREAERRRPQVAVLVDFPDFNLKLVRSLKAKGIKVVYYISPQLWAWRKYRISLIRKYVDLLITILPFEKDWYREHGVEHVEYVGHPLAREVHGTRSREDFCRDHGIDPRKPIVAMLPGSRRKEIARILPVLIDAALLVCKRQKGTRIIIPLSHERHLEGVRRPVEEAGVNATIVVNETYDAVAAADVAAVTSGTATLETGILGTPMVIVYKTSALNYKLLEPMVDVPHYGLINLIAGRRLAAELIQDDMTAGTLSNELLRLLDPDVNAAMRASLSEAAAKLGEGGASLRAAKAILRTVSS